MSESQASRVSHPKQVAALVDERARPLAARWPGVQVAVAVEQGGACWAGSWRAGVWSDDPGPRCLIYSVTKPVLALLVLQLVARGAVDLDAPVARWLPEAPHGNRVAARQLLRHTSGMPDYGPLREYHAAVRATPERPWRDEEFLARAVPGPLDFAPDAGWAYSNVGYLLLRRLVERAHGASFATLFARDVAAPLALRQARVAATLDDLLPLAPGFTDFLGPGADGAPVADVRGRYHPGWVAHGVVAAPAAEVALVLRALLDGDLLPASLRAELTSAVRVPGDHPRFTAPSYALGLMTDPAAPRGPTFGHTGGGPGYGAAAFHVRPATGAPPVTVAALGNADVSDEMEALALAVLDVLTAP